MACCVLHNIAIVNKQPLLDDDVELDELFEIPYQRTTSASSSQETALRMQGFEKRNKVATNHFG